MRIGINASGLIATGASLEQLRAHAADADDQGFDSYWLGQLAIPDALTAIVALSPEASRIELGTAVIPTWARHPLMLAAQALTAQEAIGNRLALGVGVGHKDLIEPALKLRYASSDSTWRSTWRCSGRRCDSGGSRSRARSGQARRTCRTRPGVPSRRRSSSRRWVRECCGWRARRPAA